MFTISCAVSSNTVFYGLKFDANGEGYEKKAKKAVKFWQAINMSTNIDRITQNSFLHSSQTLVKTIHVQVSRSSTQITIHLLETRTHF